MQMTAAAPYSIPTEPGRARAIALATAVHLVLLGFLWIGVRWQNETPVSVEAEIWSPQTRDAAPRPQEPEPEPLPKPPVKQEITPIPKPVAQPEDDVIHDNKPDIALEKIKKRKAELIKKQAEKQAEQLRLEKDQEQKLKRDKEKSDAEQLEKEAQQKGELKKAEAAKKRRQEDADNKKLNQIRADEMRRIQGGVAGTGGSGDAPKSQGGRVDSGYAHKVAAIIRSNTVFNVPEGLDGNPAVEYAVDLLPDGEVKGRPRKTKSSGVPGFDEAVLRAIEKSTFPPDKTGAVPSALIVSHKPKD